MVLAIKAFSSKLRLFLSGHLYELLENSSPIDNFKLFEILIEIIHSQSFDKKWISEIPQKELDKLRKNLESPDYNREFKIYIEDLTEIIRYLRNLNHNNQDVLDMKILAQNLYDKKINLGMLESSLRNTVIEIFDYLKDNFKEFTISRITQQTLYDDGNEKECGRCHELKPYSEFSMVNKRPYYICKQCELILDMINKYKKKLLVALKLYRGKLMGKCQECDTDFRRLPALDYHHFERFTKSLNFSKIKYRQSVEQIIEMLESEETILLCANCHSRKQAKLFIEFRNIILKANLFKFSGQEIFDLIKADVSKKNRKYPNQDIQRILHWIKKRFIIETVYNGKCIGCNSMFKPITVKNNLSAFDLHHLLNNIREKSKWEYLKHLDIPKIIEILKEEKIIVLCSNCHRMVKNKEFIENLAEIYEGNLNKYIPNIRRDYEIILKNINNFRFSRINISDPLEKKTIHDAWEDILVAIYKTLVEKGKNRFDKHLLLKLDDITDAGALYRIRMLKRKGLVETIKKGGPTIPATHRLTKKGIETAKSLIHLQN